ncbi:MAG TPA: hypothetical protein VM934_09390 [Pyrinomonadaceae bacterium]|jgi:hypothetical protein|nr:hypothetical protein [Pyrinomonadaceae bacterium]
MSEERGERKELTCKNPPCSCRVDKKGDSCSVHCESTGNTTQIDCDCGHPDCSGDF